MARKISFFDGASSSTTPTIGNIVASDLVTYADDATFEANESGAPVEGNIYFNTTTKLVRFYNGTVWTSIVDEDGVQTLTNKTLNASGALGGTGSIKTDADDIWFNNTISGLAAAQVQDAIDLLDGKVDTNETDIGTNTTNIGTNTTNIGTNDTDITNLQNDKLDASEKGAINGVAELDGSGLVPTSQLPTKMMEYEGDWDGSTNTPTLANTDTGKQGTVYRATPGGTVDFGAGNITFTAGDWVYNNGTTWEKSVETTLPDTDSLPEGSTNLYNQTHTGEVTGATALTVGSTAISNKTEVVPESGDFFLFSDTSDSGNLKKADFDTIGGGSGSGGINYITNPDAETNANDWNLYNDGAVSEPVDGTGGTPAGVTFTQLVSAGGALRGGASFLFNKDGANRQGQGVSTDIEIDNIDKNKMLNLEVSYQTGLNYASGDVGMYIYDVDNAAVITPFDIDIAESDVVQQTITTRFQATSSKNYRLIFHIKTTNVNSTQMKLDNIKVGPDVVVPGAIITPWESYTPSITGFGTTTGVAFQWRRVGSNYEITGEFSSGTHTAVEAQISLPNSKAIGLTGVTGPIVVGNMGFDVVAAAHRVVLATDGDTFLNLGIASSAFQPLTPRTATNFTSNSDITIFCSIPIDGLSAGASLSTTETLFSTAKAKYNTNAGQTINDNATDIIDFEDIVYDDLGSVTTGGSWAYTAPKNGVYNVTAGVKSTNVAQGAGDIWELFVYVNGTKRNTLDFHEYSDAFTGFSQVSGSAEIKVEAGDTIDIRLNIAVGTASKTLSSVPEENFVCISEQPDFSVFSVYAERGTAYIKDVKANNTDGGGFTSGSWQTRDLNTLEGDDLGIAVSTNQFTLPPGKYSIEAVAPALAVQNHKIKLRNITDSTDDIIGKSGHTGSSGVQVTDSSLHGNIIITSSKTFEIQHRGSVTRATDGFGLANNFSVDEVYTQVKIEKLA